MTQKEFQVIQILHWLSNPMVAVIVAVLAIWTLVWKGVALWKAARNGQGIWYVILLVVNTVGILEIIYIFFFNKPKES